MKLSEAIEILTIGIQDYEEPAIYDFQRAVKLGIEALKFKQAWRKGHYFRATYLLPGETEE